MSKYTRRGREAIRDTLRTKTQWLDHPSYLDGHRIAYADRHPETATLRMFCKRVVVVAVRDLTTPEMTERAEQVLRCEPCREELERLDRLLRDDPAGHARELDRLFLEGRAAEPD